MCNVCVTFYMCRSNEEHVMVCSWGKFQKPITTSLGRINAKTSLNRKSRFGVLIMTFR
jgi:hypothetical protein